MSEVTPLVFISAVSGDLRSARDIVKNGLLNIGCHPIVQEHFEPGYQTVKNMLKTKVERCQAVIHLIGRHYGGEPDPDSLPAGAPRRSWTQMEHDIARELGIKTYLFVFDDSYPFDPSEEEPDDEVALQEAHRQRILRGQYIYNQVKSPEELARRVIEMRLEAAELRKLVDQSNHQLTDALGTMERNAGELKDGQREILSSVEEMRQSFSSFAEMGGIIPEPTSPEQFYFNAKLSEMKGDYGKVRKYFIEYFRFDVECIDPHLLFIQFLKVQEGLAGARETYRQVVRNSQSVVHQLAESLLWDRGERVGQLEAFLQVHSECGPGYYLLSEDYSKTRLGTRTLADKAKEKQLLERFLLLDQEGKVVRWFVDQSVVSEWQEDAVNRLNDLANGRAVLEDPVSVSWMSHSNGWVGTIQIGEIATEIFWREPGAENFTSTGFLSSRSYSTGQPQPQQIIELPKVTEKTTVEVAYKNLNGEMMGPFSSLLDPFFESHAGTKQILNISKRSWVGIRDYNGKTLLYFTHLLVHRGGLKQIAYGLNSNPRFRVLFPEYDKPGMAPIAADLPVFVTIPNETQFVTVQLTFKDGSVSEIVKVEH